MRYENGFFELSERQIKAILDCAWERRDVSRPPCEQVQFCPDKRRVVATNGHRLLMLVALGGDPDGEPGGRSWCVRVGTLRSALKGVDHPGIRRCSHTLHYHIGPSSHDGVESFPPYHRLPLRGGEGKLDAVGVDARLLGHIGNIAAASWTVWSKKEHGPLPATTLRTGKDALSPLCLTLKDPDPGSVWHYTLMPTRLSRYDDQVQAVSGQVRKQP